MEIQHKLLHGTQLMTQKEIDLINRVNGVGPQLDNLINDIKSYLEQQYSSETIEGKNRISFCVEPFKWLDEGKTDLQVGLMKLNRAITQPGSF
jgi:uncharacterized protein YjgD (DUF1641 family)